MTKKTEPSTVTNSSAGATTYLDREMVEPEVRSFAGGLAAVYSARSPDKETPNEDAAALISISDTAGVLVVADGMGGGPAGERASELAIDALRRAIEGASDALPRTAILDGFEEANRAVREFSAGAATTLAVVEVSADGVRPYHVGDSLILGVGLRGKIKVQTLSHSPLGYAVESGLMDESEALHHDERHIVSNIVGLPEMRIDVGASVPLASRDTILLATDGLFDNLETAEIVETMRGGTLGKSVRRLAQTATRRMKEPRPGRPSKPDDLTMVAFRRWGKA